MILADCSIYAALVMSGIFDETPLSCSSYKKMVGKKKKRLLLEVVRNRKPLGVKPAEFRLAVQTSKSALSVLGNTSISPSSEAGTIFAYRVHVQTGLLAAGRCCSGGCCSQVWFVSGGSYCQALSCAPSVFQCYLKSLL